MSSSGTEKAHGCTPDVLVLVVREVAMVSSWGRENVVVSMLVSALKPATQPCPTWGLLPWKQTLPLTRVSQQKEQFPGKLHKSGGCQDTCLRLRLV